jgi:ABC-2 type transport system permease protein
MTAPVRDLEIVLGKWVAAVGYAALLWLPTLPILMLLASDPILGQDLSYGPVFSAYLGLFLLGAMLLAAGLFTSSLTDNVLLAAIIAMILNLGLILAPNMLHPQLREWFGDSYLLQVFMEQTNVFDQLSNWFGRGQVDTSKISFYLGGMAFFLFLTVRSLESRKWR